MSVRYFNRKRREARERGRRMGLASGRARRARREEMAMGNAAREVRVIEIVIRDSHRPMTRMRAEQCQDDEGRWGRLRMEGGAGRPVGRRGLGERVARAVL